MDQKGESCGQWLVRGMERFEIVPTTLDSNTFAKHRDKNWGGLYERRGGYKVPPAGGFKI